MNSGVKKKIFPLVMLSFTIFIISLFWRQAQRNELLKEYEITFGTIVKLRSNMGAHYIQYKYVVNNEAFEGYQLIRAKFWHDTLIGLNNLKLKYATEDHEISTVIDERFK